MSKGSADRGNVVVRGKASCWCECGKLKGGKECNCSPLPNHPICNVLAEACGYDVNEEQCYEECTIGAEGCADGQDERAPACAVDATTGQETSVDKAKEIHGGDV